MDEEQRNIDQYLRVIDEIEKIRTRNNVNWMDVLRLAFIHAPEKAKELMRKIDTEDNRVSDLVKKLAD